MKIALLTSVAGNGGSAHTAFHTARLLSQAGHEAVLFAPGTYWPERGRREGVRVERLLALRRGFRASTLADLVRLRGWLKRSGTEVVIVQKSPEQWLAHYAIAMLGRRPALVRMRGVVFPVKPSAFNRRLHNRMDLVLCSASAIAAQYRALEGFRTDRVQVLLEGVDAERFRPASPEERLAAREKFKLDPAALYVGTAGRPSPVKGHDLLVRAFAEAFGRLTTRSQQAKLKMRKVRLAVFSDESRRGPGSYPELGTLCNEASIASHVDLRPGQVEDMREVYRALDIYVLPSRGSEGSSRAGLEACASGLPLLASRVGVLPDLVEDGVSGRLVPPDDEEALTGALQEWIEAWPEAKRLGEAARARIEAQFRERDYAARLVALLEAAARARDGVRTGVS